jgi:hypothetical protein
VDLYDSMRSVGRKFLLAGVGGLNLTHAEAAPLFVSRYGERHTEVGAWLEQLAAADVRAWAAGLGVETFVGSSQRVFPVDFKAAPLLRAWLRRLRSAGVRIYPQHRWLGFEPNGAQRLRGPESQFTVAPRATVLALGGASWPQLGSDGAWVPVLSAVGATVAPLRPANCGFEVHWSARLREQYAGQPLKPVLLHWTDQRGLPCSQQGELMLTEHGLEGGLIYAHAAELREQIAKHGAADIALDLQPGRSFEQLHRALSQPRGSMSWPKWLMRRAGLDGLRVALLFESGQRPMHADPAVLAQTIKHLPLRLHATRPVAEAISSAGGVHFAALDPRQMLRAVPGVFCAGEMIDWEAPTGGYLLTACLASGRAAGQGVLQWLAHHDSAG